MKYRRQKNDEQCSVVNNSVEGTPALWSSAKARDLIIFQWELIVIGNFFINSYWLFTVDYNLLLAFDRDYFCVAIWLKETKKLLITMKYIRPAYSNHLLAVDKINWVR